MAQSTRRKINWIKTFYMLRQRKDTIKRDMRRFLHLSHHKGNLSILLYPSYSLQCKRHSPFSFRCIFQFPYYCTYASITAFKWLEKPGDFATHVLLWGISALIFDQFQKNSQSLPYFLLRIWVKGFESSFCLVYLATFLAWHRWGRNAILKREVQSNFCFLSLSCISLAFWIVKDQRMRKYG